MQSADVVTDPPAPPAPAQPKLDKVFISYAHADQEFAARLRKDLEARGVTVWMDMSIEKGAKWSQTIDDALDASDTLVLVVSPTSRKSDFVDKELQAAIYKQMHIVPVIHRKTRAWTLIANIQHIDFTAWYDEGLAKLLNETPPKRPWWRWALILLKKSWMQSLLLILALTVAMAVLRHYTAPSKTTASLAAADKWTIVLRLSNDGGRPSMVMADKFRMHFQGVPVEPEVLKPAEPVKSIAVPGHGHADIRLKFANVLTPRPECNGEPCTRAQAFPLIPEATISVAVEVTESDNRKAIVEEKVRGSRVREFIEAMYPEVPEP